MAQSSIQVTNSFSYYATSVGTITLGTWTNSTSSRVLVTSAKAYVGTGYGNFTANTHVSGNGESISLALLVGSSASNTITITNRIIPKDRTANYDQLEQRTLEFSSPISVAAGATVDVKVRVSGSGTCLCLANSSAAPHYRPYHTQLVYSTGYNITYNLNGGAWPGSAPSGTNVTSVTTVQPIRTYTLTYDKNGSSSYSGGTKSITAPFVSWNTNASGTGTSYAPGASISSNLTLYAIWGSAKIGDLPQIYGVLSWNTRSDGTGTTVTSSTIISKDTTIYAIWQEVPSLPDQFLVVFKDGNTTLASGMVNKEQSAEALATTAYNQLSAAKKKAFKGWSADYTNITYNLTVYALYDNAYIWIMTADRGWVPYTPKE